MDTNRSIEASVTRFQETHMKLDAVYAQLAKTCGLSVTEYWSLLLAHQGSTAQREISVCLSVSKQTLNSALKALQQKRLVYLKRSEDNLRIKQIVLTNEGQRFVEEHISRMSSLEAQAWQALTATERARLTELSQKFCALLLAALAQAEILPTIFDKKEYANEPNHHHQP